MESILTSIKKLLGPSEENDAFDTDIIIHINTAFMSLRQLGVGPTQGFRIEDKDDKWSDFIPNMDMMFYEGLKTYIYLKVKLVFDPPLNSSVLASYKEQILELEWRLTNP